MMLKQHKTVVIIAALWFLVLSAFVAHKSGWLQLAVAVLFFPYLGCLLSSPFAIVRSWRTYKLRALIPLGACVAASFGAIGAGSFAQEQLFAHYLPRYQAIVDAVRLDALPLDAKAEPLELSQSDKKIVYFALAQKTRDGALIVELTTEEGFPVKHSGYVYSSSGALPRDSFIGQRWPYVREVRPKWFRVAD